LFRLHGRGPQQQNQYEEGVAHYSGVSSTSSMVFVGGSAFTPFIIRA
jgi:hypothetical protein